MNNKKKKLFTLHTDLDAFMPASDKDKEYMVQMRPSSTFFKDGVKRLYKNKIAFISFIVICLITISSIIIPMFWPYSYDTQLGVTPGKPVDNSYLNLQPFEYGKTEQKKWMPVKASSPICSALTQAAEIISSVWSTVPVSLWLSDSSPVSSCC